MVNRMGKRKLIFLDIDGVMNSSSSKGPYLSDMETSKLLLLAKLVAVTASLGIVISSDRRESNADMKEKKAAFAEYGIPVVGETRLPNEDDLDDSRGRQIADYLVDQEEDIDAILILDDHDEGISSYFEEEFLKTNPYYGFDEEAFDAAISILGMD